VPLVSAIVVVSIPTVVDLPAPFGPDQRPVAVVGFTVAAGRVVELDLITDPGRLDAVAGSLVDA
jgi:hypothetical protein